MSFQEDTSNKKEKVQYSTGTETEKVLGPQLVTQILNI